MIPTIFIENLALLLSCLCLVFFKSSTTFGKTSITLICVLKIHNEEKIYTVCQVLLTQVFWTEYLHKYILNNHRSLIHKHKWKEWAFKKAQEEKCKERPKRQANKKRCVVEYLYLFTRCFFIQVAENVPSGCTGATMKWNGLKMDNPAPSYSIHSAVPVVEVGARGEIGELIFVA